MRTWVPGTLAHSKFRCSQSGKCAAPPAQHRRCSSHRCPSRSRGHPNALRVLTQSYAADTPCLPALLKSSLPNSRVAVPLCCVKHALSRESGGDTVCQTPTRTLGRASIWATAQGRAGAPASASAASTPTTIPAIAPAGKPPPPPPPPPLPPSGRTGIVDSGAEELRASAVVSGAGAGAASAPAGGGDGAAGGCPAVRLSMLAPAPGHHTAPSGP